MDLDHVRAQHREHEYLVAGNIEPELIEQPLEPCVYRLPVVLDDAFERVVGIEQGIVGRLGRCGGKPLLGLGDATLGGAHPRQRGFQSILPGGGLLLQVAPLGSIMDSPALRTTTTRPPTEY